MPTMLRNNGLEVKTPCNLSKHSSSPERIPFPLTPLDHKYHQFPFFKFFWGVVLKLYTFAISQFCFVLIFVYLYKIFLNVLLTYQEAIYI